MALQPSASGVKTVSRSDPHAITSSLNPKTTKYEFGGPIGALAITLFTPLTIYGLFLGCSEFTGGCPPPMASIMPTLTSRRWWEEFWNPRVFGIYLLWYAFCVVTWRVLPGDWKEGGMLRNGQKKVYKMNAIATLFTTIGAVSGILTTKGLLPFIHIYQNWLAYVTSAVVMATAQALWSYFISFGKDKLLALGGNSGNPIYDFFIGRELNPSTSWLDDKGFDLKTFNELRPGLIGWLLVNFSCACEQMMRMGRYSWPTDSMILINVFQFVYVFDSLVNEKNILTQMDIVTDGFGFMLAIGDLAWLPFVYSLQARYLAFKPVTLGPFWCSVVFGLNAIGYYIFRTSNYEKDTFRNGRNPKKLASMKTARGTELLTGGWWGRSRHPNYFGDLIMGLAWCMTTGLRTPITYFYFFYFTALLVHRQMRDDEACAKKYGSDWDKYKQLVKYKIVPYVY